MCNREDQTAKKSINIVKIIITSKIKINHSFFLYSLKNLFRFNVICVYVLLLINLNIERYLINQQDALKCLGSIMANGSTENLIGK